VFTNSAHGLSSFRSLVRMKSRACALMNVVEYSSSTRFFPLMFQFPPR
jgi:hypothetical protein